MAWFVKVASSFKNESRSNFNVLKPSRHDMPTPSSIQFHGVHYAIITKDLVPTIWRIQAHSFTQASFVPQPTLTPPSSTYYLDPSTAAPPN